eukprot:CAMPEP_0204330156 /NCGR_PEP_ID=MMETSP0469-20131031/14700_1 /ASSEMBLY_ACC=CAM_ASM_000384 /TAXON_ID=2969 /ORGANISM="Oxyrrhis marina" /LENGTH=78 /DNA_ID=CAMNT_0051312887 /DNA_START=158 /DNA_END=394 /DNA_ORIENTATION=-
MVEDRGSPVSELPSPDDRPGVCRMGACWVPAAAGPGTRGGSRRGGVFGLAAWVGRPADTAANAAAAAAFAAACFCSFS